MIIKLLIIVYWGVFGLVKFENILVFFVKVIELGVLMVEFDIRKI